ncbi:hypothetical protein COY93_02480 [Candidatus Uhrbacteria bacterium CG_4_10_14_0_8_um_filter_58_22]|uniref:Uncharacterized protein n=1 Tax=Candidatus Uhrbacteria bacterium CG_4_10_14_0_8_um_filter_58_22 TaxID=1975029 RepID=A0A2M7Q9Y8_9BACT|nr:MAG: hypothetical protein COY93_02480 [Candidatus Uhrbacteria bacterium CG_4_10_14_0_8_um_filter_58_22]
MNSIRSEKIGEKTKTGGGLWAAARFWLALTLFSLTAIGISYVLLSTRDTLLLMVPADVAVYLHTQESYGRKLIASASEVDLTAFSGLKETAAYARRTDQQPDSKLEWTLLLRWPFYAAPSQDLTAELSTAGFDRIDRTTFILSGPKNLTAPKFGLLAKNRKVSRALASVRTLAKTQAYVQALDEPVDDPENPWIAAVPKKSFVLGLFDRPDRDFTATLLPIDAAADFLPFLGPSLPITTTDELPIPLPFDRSQISTISFSTLKTDLNLLPMLFGETELARQAIDAPDSDQLDAARENLNQILTGPISVLVTSRTDPTDESQKSSLVAYLPKTGPDDLKMAVSHYLKTSFPRKEGLLLPDQSFWPEFFASNLSQAASVDDIDPYKIEPLGTGSVFSDDQVLLEQTISDFTEERPISCLGVDSFESIVTNRTLILPWFDLKFFNFSTEREFRPVFIQKIGDNITHICG